MGGGVLPIYCRCAIGKGGGLGNFCLTKGYIFFDNLLMVMFGGEIFFPMLTRLIEEWGLET